MLRKNLVLKKNLNFFKKLSLLCQVQQVISAQPRIVFVNLVNRSNFPNDILIWNHQCPSIGISLHTCQ